jgi:hypothetical protein
MKPSAFVIQKYQLYKRVHAEKTNCDEAVTYIIELLHDKIRSLVKVSKPKTFVELREIVRCLEEDDITRVKWSSTDSNSGTENSTNFRLQKNNSFENRRKE